MLLYYTANGITNSDVIMAIFKGRADCGVNKSDHNECPRIIQLLVHAKNETKLVHRSKAGAFQCSR